MISNIRVFLCDDDHLRFFGEGPCRLLHLIEETGSLRSAAAQMGLSYSKALRLVQHAEKELGFALPCKTIGGRGGGGSTLTDILTLVVSVVLLIVIIRSMAYVFASPCGWLWCFGGPRPPRGRRRGPHNPPPPPGGFYGGFGGMGGGSFGGGAGRGGFGGGSFGGGFGGMGGGSSHGGGGGRGR